MTRRTTEELREQVLKILSKRSPLRTAAIGWALYPEAPNRWARSCEHGARRVLKSLERDGLAKFDGRHWMSSDFAYGRHPKDTGRYVPKKLSQARLARLITRLNERIVTIDMDGTVYDPWACCNGEDYSKIGTAKCRHIREDVMNEARALADSLDASLVVVSWRSRGDMATQRWLKLVGLKVDAVFIPETPDDMLVCPSLRSCL